jgi:RNA polymerase sigma factor (sigma-70 family)
MKPTSATTFHSTLDGRELSACRDREPSALSVVYRRYQNAVYTLCLRLLGEREAALDHMQESFIDAFENLRTYRADAPFGAWLRAIVVHRCLRTLRNQKSLSSLDQSEQSILEHALAPDTISRLEQSHDLLAALNGLKPKMRAVLWLYFVEGYSHEEIASAFAQSLSFSKSTVARGALAVRTQLEPHHVH